MDEGCVLNGLAFRETPPPQLRSDLVRQAGKGRHSCAHRACRRYLEQPMIRGMVSLSLKFRVLIIGAAAAIFVLGVVQLPSAAMDVFPEFGPPQVQIQAEALGLSAAEVEQLITVPIEQDLLNGVAWLDQIRSESVPGRSSIALVSDPGTDLLRARQAVQERLSQAHALPNVGSAPIMIQPLSSTSRAL